MPYCTAGQAAALDPNLEQTDVQEDWLEWADGLVDQYREKTYADEVEVTEALDGTGNDLIVLSNRPVTEVSAVLISTAAIASGSYAWYRNGQIRLRPWPPAMGMPPPAWPVGRQNVSVTYKYGLASSESVPREVALCAAQLVCLIARYVKEGQITGLAERWKIGTVSLDREAKSGGFVTDAQAVMEATLGPRPPAIYG